MPKVNSVCIIANSTKPESIVIATKVEEYLKTLSIKTVILSTYESSDSLDIAYDTDLVITLGGDGTVLSAARLVAERGIPILPVNLGTFGYITEIAKEELLDTLKAYLEGTAAVSRRLMLRVTVLRKGNKVFNATSLNEAVVSSSGIAKVISLNLFLDKTLAGTFRADGMIVATPTGSTGYSLAAGGPILDPEMSALIVTPICPFTLSYRPLVTSDKVVSIEVRENQRAAVVLTVDGQVPFSLEEGDKVTIEKSRSRMILMNSLKRNFTEVIREKLNWSGDLHA
ncbi:MAG: NAD(+)/NADH kinase [Spirochaetales bacterium]|nr:NAD(+)/NADH kinase [Spirochaetales bacterium]